MLQELARARTSIDDDFHAWVVEQVELFRRRRFEDLDFENVLEELDYLARKERSAITSNLRVLLAHLLKWQYQPDKRKPGWRGSIVEHRRRIDAVLERSPGLAGVPAESLAGQYRKARSDAAGETGLPLNTFPTEPPYAVDQVLSPAFFPDSVDEA